MKEQSPKIMFIRVIENCNANCFMCNYARETNGKELTELEFNNLIKEMKKSEYQLIKFTGGEPLLHKGLKNFIKISKINGYKTSIITNGYLLNNKYKYLIYSGLDHITISLDSNKPEVHDKIRGINGLYNKIINSIKEIKKYKSNVKIRINTVGSYLNIFDLIDIYKLLSELYIDQWVITPLKSTINYWNINMIDKYYEAYLEFKKYVSEKNEIQLLGYTRDWAGRNKEEFINLIKNNKLYRPNGKCYLVDKLRFYIPSKGILIPCNSAAHRLDEIQTSIDSKNGLEENAKIMAEWLKEFGSKKCTGCGPINVWLAENPELLDDDVFSF